MARMASAEGLEVMRPELGSKPRVYYRNLWRYSKCFIGGTLSAEAGGVVDCVEGAREYVREHPIAALGMALAAGYVLSMIMRSRG